MRFNAGLTGLLVALLVLSCTGQGAIEHAQPGHSVFALYGTSQADLQLLSSGDLTGVAFGNVNSAGSFCRVTFHLESASFTGQSYVADGLLCVIIPNDTTVDIGVVPVAEEYSSHATIWLNSDSVRQVSTPPTGSANRVTDLTVSDIDGEQVVLKWTEVNLGDNDFNGEVNIADISPLAHHFGEKYNRSDPDARQLTVYWIDGDKNGEINVADLTTIGLNYGQEIAGYYILRNGELITDPETQSPLLVARKSATFKDPPTLLPPVYSAIVDGMNTDDWSVVPVDGQGGQGSISTGTIIGNRVDAKASVVIKGINLWKFPDTASSSFDGGFSMLRVILPGDDVDWMEIGEGLGGPDGVAVFEDLPKETQLFLEIAYAPKTDLLTGEPVAREAATENPFCTRMPFILPESEDQIEFAPEIVVDKDEEEGVTIDLRATLTTAQGTEELHSRLLLTAGLVSYDTDGDGSFIDQPFLADSNLDSVSDQRIQLLLDRRAYEGGTELAWLHRGTVTLYDEAGGYVVLSGAEYFDEGSGMFTPEPLPGEIRYDFNELTPFHEPGKTYMDPGSIVVGQQLEISGFSLSKLSEGLLKKYWANDISRIVIP